MKKRAGSSLGWVVVLLLCGSIQAQDSLAYWEEQAWQYADPPAPDSLAYYYPRIAGHYRAADELEGFLYAYWDWQAALFDDSPAALSLLDTAARQIWRKPAGPAEAEALLWLEVNRGYHRFQLGRITAAVEAYERALHLYQSHRFPDFEALDYLYLPLGAHYTRLGDNEKARTLYEQAISSQSEQAGPGTLAGLYNNLGLTYWNEGQQTKAIKAYRQGWSLPGLPLEQTGLLYLSAGRSYRAMGQEDTAAAFAEKALHTLRPLQQSDAPPEGLNDYLSGAWLLYGQLMSSQGRNDAALQALRKARQLAQNARRTQYHRTVAKTDVAIGDALLKARQPGQALRAYHAALCSLFPELPEAPPTALPDSTQLYGENTIYEALAGKAEALFALYQQTSDESRLLLAYRCHQLAGQAERELRRWLLYESSQINLLAQSRTRISRAISIARLLYEQTQEEHYLRQAWAFAEQLKSAVLRDAIKRHSGLGKEAQAIQRLRKQIAYFERQLLLNPGHDNRVSWLTERDALREQLQAAYEASGQEAAEEAQNRFQPGRIATAEGSAIVEYFAGETSVHAFACLPNGELRWELLGHPDSLKPDVVAFRQLLQDRQALETTNAYPQLAYHLYQALVAPVLPELPGQLLIVPDAWLSVLPFEALFTRPGPANWAAAPFALRETDFYYAFSLGVLEQQRQMSANTEGGLLHFAPRFADRTRALPPLLHTDSEIPQGWSTTAYLDSAANWSTLQRLSGHHRIIHLSTHANAADSLPRVELYDRPAYLPDIYALPLRAELVVLSACETGLGVFEQGEGVMSLSRAFTYAGSRGLVSSLWAINESATADLLHGAYLQLEKGRGKAQALAEAKRQYLTEEGTPAFRKSPYYWAGLVYVGEAGALQLLPGKRSPAISRNIWAAGLTLVFLLLFIWLFFSLKKRKRKAAR